MRIDIVLIILILALVMLGGSFVDGMQIRQQLSDVLQQLSDALVEKEKMEIQIDGLEGEIQSCELENIKLNQENMVLRKNVEKLEKIQTQACLNNNDRVGTSPASWIIQAVGLISLVGMQVITIRSRRPSHQNSRELEEKPDFILLSKEERQMIIRQRRKSG